MGVESASMHMLQLRVLGSKEAVNWWSMFATCSIRGWVYNDGNGKCCSLTYNCIGLHVVLFDFIWLAFDDDEKQCCKCLQTEPLSSKLLKFLF
jgi:hypothetical protein